MVTKEQFLKDFGELISSDAEIELETDLLDIDEWDSFSAVSFLAMIDEKYGVKLEPFAVAEAVCVEDLFDTVNANLKSNGGN